VNVPLVDLAAQHAAIAGEIDAAIARVVDSSSFILGREVAAFESEFAAYCGTDHCIGVGSGTDALQIALLACGVASGDEVVVPAHTFGAAAFAASLIGAVPVFVDIESTTYTLDATRVEEALTERTRAIIPVHLYGQCADTESLLDLARDRGIVVIEDAAQAHGAELSGRRAGSLGDIACFSFYPTKNLGCLGDGGAVTTNDANLAERVRRLRDYGRIDRYRHTTLGLNSRLDELQAAVLRVKLPYLDTWNDARRRTGRRYNELLSGAVVTPATGDRRTHVYHLYVVRSPFRDRLAETLCEHGVGTEVHYPVPLHRQPLYERLPSRSHNLDVSDAVASEVLSLPMFPTIADAQLTYVAAIIRSFRT